MGNIITSPESEDDNIKDYLKKVKEKFENKWEIQNKNDKLVSYFVKGEHDFQKTVGTGSFGRVMVCYHKTDEKYVAVKCLSKDCIIEKEQLEHTYSEYKIMATIPEMQFLVNMMSFGQDNAYLYMVFEFVPGGELFSLLRSVGRIPEITATFYGSQVLSALHYLHNLDILYRDLKPENILFAPNGYLKLTDFGFAKRCPGRTFTLCGTPEYLAPEIILCQGYHKAVDWWAFGVLLFEMVCGHPPFYSENPMEIYKQSWLQKRHLLRMRQRGVKFNRSRFFDDVDQAQPTLKCFGAAKHNNSTNDSEHDSSFDTPPGEAGSQSNEVLISKVISAKSGLLSELSLASVANAGKSYSNGPCSLTYSISRILQLHNEPTDSGEDLIEFPIKVSAKFKDLILRLLQTDPTKRLGNLKEGPFGIKNHKLFKCVKWQRLFDQSIRAPYIPKVKGDDDTRNYKMFSDFDFLNPKDEKHAEKFSIFPKK